MNVSISRIAVKMALTIAAGLGSSAAFAVEEFSEFRPLIEINSTDGDIGFHMLLDGDAWKVARVFDGDGDRMLRVRGTDDLDEQGITEIFFESAEPLCWDDGSGEETVTLEEFVDRFEAGVYSARGRTLDGERLVAQADFSHAIPAAPQVEVQIERSWGELEVEVEWRGGNDLGRCEYPAGLIPDPATVAVVLWEIVIEPNEDEVPEGIAVAKFAAQVPGYVDDLEISEEFIEAYTKLGVTTFKYEVGAIAANGNRTFTEGEFELESADEE